MIKIAPSILSADYLELGKAVRDLEMWEADYIHCDIMDGNYVPNISFGPGIVNAVRNCTKLQLDVHLMIEKPEYFIDPFVKAGADIITFHPEVCYHPHRTLQSIKSAGKRGGIVITPGMSLEPFEPLLADCDIVLIMTVNPGFGGQKFIENTLVKIQKLADFKIKNKLNFEIEVDGGINLDTAKLAVAAGAEVLVAGNSIFTADNPGSYISAMRG